MPTGFLGISGKVVVKGTVKFCEWDRPNLSENAQHCDSHSAVESDTQSDSHSDTQSAVSDTQSAVIIAESAVVCLN